MICVAAFCRRRYRVWASPVVIVFLWWSGWLLVALLDLIGIPAPSVTLVALVMTAVFFFLLGALAGPYRRRRQIPVVDRADDDRSVQAMVKFWTVVSLFALVPVLIVFRTGASQLAVADLSSYRDDALGGARGASTLYGSAAFEIFYGAIVSPLLFGALIWIVVRGWRPSLKERVLFVGVALLVILDSFAKFGRTTLYFFVIAVLLAARFRANASTRGTGLVKRSRKTKLIASVAALAVLIGLLAVLSYYRLGREDVSIGEILGYFAVWYHTTGFALLDTELTDRASHLNSAVTYGLASIGGLYNYVVYGLHVLGIEIPSVARDNGIIHNEYVRIGYSTALSVPIFSNAYYTVLYSIFQDFRWFGATILSFVFGFVVDRGYTHFVQDGRDSSLYLLIVYLYLGLFGIFQSPLESPMFWIPLLTGLILRRWWSSTTRPVDIRRRSFRVGSNPTRALREPS